MQALLQNIIEDPANSINTWLVLADWLEERSDPRSDLIRLRYDYNFRKDLSLDQKHDLFYKLIREGVKPIIPSFTNSIGMEFVYVPAGSFWADDHGKKFGRHKEVIENSFYLGRYPVTHEQWQKLMGNNTSYFSSSAVRNKDLKDFPVECVSFLDVHEFIKKMNQDSQLEYRLPTLVEWEYSCRAADNSQKGCSYNYYLNQPTNTLTTKDANCLGKRTNKVGSYAPNVLGLYDMHGNVWEWCNIRYIFEDPANSINTLADCLEERSDPRSDLIRLRLQKNIYPCCGGSWSSSKRFACASSFNFSTSPNHRSFSIGFRVLATKKE